MSALSQAAEIYRAHGMDLPADLEHYLACGYVFSTPDRLLLARPLDLARGVDYWLADPRAGDAWYVKLAVGSGCLGWFLQQAPFPKPFIAWARGFKGTDRLHVYPFAQLQRRLAL